MHYHTANKCLKEVQIIMQHLQEIELTAMREKSRPMEMAISRVRMELDYLKQCVRDEYHAKQP